MLDFNFAIDTYVYYEGIDFGIDFLHRLGESHHVDFELVAVDDGVGSLFFNAIVDFEFCLRAEIQGVFRFGGIQFAAEAVGVFAVPVEDAVGDVG